jgi:hypothetical protein
MVNQQTIEQHMDTVQHSTRRVYFLVAIIEPTSHEARSQSGSAFYLRKTKLDVVSACKRNTATGCRS